MPLSNWVLSHRFASAHYQLKSETEASVRSMINLPKSFPSFCALVPGPAACCAATGTLPFPTDHTTTIALNAATALNAVLLGFENYHAMGYYANYLAQDILIWTTILGLSAGLRPQGVEQTWRNSAVQSLACQRRSIDHVCYMLQYHTRKSAQRTI